MLCREVVDRRETYNKVFLQQNYVCPTFLSAGRSNLGGKCYINYTKRDERPRTKIGQCNTTFGC